MNEFKTRVLSGIVYAAAIFFGLWYGRVSSCVLFLVLGLLCLFEVQKLLNFRNYLSYLIYPISLFIFHYFEIDDKILFLLLLCTFFVKLLLLRDLFSLKGRNAFREKKHIITLFYIVPSFVFLTLIPTLFENYNTFVLLSVFILMWVNDSFAYLVGKNFGKQKLFEKISPKKTVEGFLGGFIFTIIGGIAISYFSDIMSFYHWVVLGVFVSIFGTLGDLVQSKFKRKADVKDSGKILPGHGGVFDRMDSIIFSSTFAFGFLFLVQHVS
jgi:phosphatidate cytidylyltransferase